MMRKVLLSIPPALSTLLFCAHLLYHGVPLAAAAAPLGALILLAVKGAGATRLLALLHVLFACGMGESRREDRHAKARDGRFDSSCA